MTSEPAAPPYSTRDVDALRLPSGSRDREVVAVEEPLEIRIGGEPVAVTMRTPGHDEELALGFCLTEGIAPRSARLPDDLAANTVEVEADGFDPERLRRHFYTSSSCGVCGKGAIEAVQVDAPRVESALTVAADVVSLLPERLRAAQQVFAATGGLHATGLFSPEGELLCVREDVGRHNAMDKVVGWAFGRGLAPARAARPVRERAALVRARPEGCGCRLSRPRRRRSAFVARGRARDRPRGHALRLGARGPPHRLHRAVADRVDATGILLVGGASERFGSPKALALFRGESLAERGWRTLRDVCAEVLAVGKAHDESELPFELVDDGTDERAPVFGVDRRPARCCLRDVHRRARRLPARHS